MLSKFTELFCLPADMATDYPSRNVSLEDILEETRRLSESSASSSSTTTSFLSSYSSSRSSDATANAGAITAAVRAATTFTSSPPVSKAAKKQSRFRRFTMSAKSGKS